MINTYVIEQKNRDIIFHESAAPDRFSLGLRYLSDLLGLGRLCGTEIQGAAILAHKYYNVEPWHGTLIMWASLLLALAVNLVGGRFLPRVENLILVVHILGFFGILIPLTSLSDHKTKKEVFTEFLNGGNFASQGLSSFLGMTGFFFAFSGGDAAVYVSDKIAEFHLCKG